MIRPSITDLVLTLSRAVLCTLAAPAANEVSSLDACGSFGAKNGADVAYADVANCYKSILFDNKIAASTIGTIQLLFNDYHIFRDAALTPNLKSSFSCPPVDILKELRSAGAAKYADDFSFHTALSTTRLLHPNLFDQDLLLYAPVINGKQSIRVFKDLRNRGYENREVKKVNGQDAFTYLSKWSSSPSESKDAGVRLNEALVTLQIEGYGETLDFVADPGAFAKRSTLPEETHIDYEIQCESNPKVVSLQENWKVAVVEENAEHLKRFKNAHEYLTKSCLPKNSTSVDDSETSDMDSTSLRTFPTRERADRHERLRVRRIEDEEAPPKLQGAKVVHSHKNSVCIVLTAHPTIGVVVVPTHARFQHQLDQYEGLVKGLIELYKRNVTHRGMVEYAYELVRAFFPNKDGFDISLTTDLRDPKIIQDLAAAVYKQEMEVVYDASRYLDLKTREPHSSAAMFTQPVQKTVNGRTDSYTQLAMAAPSETNEYKELETLPWTNNLANIHILTDGRCGSACGLSTHMFSAYKNVSVTAIGGFKDQPLSMFSFVGGVVQDVEDILESYRRAKMNAPLKDFPYSAGMLLPVTLKYAQKSNIPLEYDYAHHPANERLDFDPKNARDRVALWIQVATRAWNLWKHYE
ncbi:hypothetical protein BGZ70_008094 [Mortierella alpina]|uniref:CPAF-like PDZ domain-containing protein n=1 Tax=Mortierella alpina TaxID=64518 RepID=A0A9P6J4P7_MORAP|nr:hypothetical protein BGZ70_008094 [Mortierella alpina]